jgi:MSHA biogenesis protein MshO
MKIKSAQFGFTLIEMIIVIVITGILGGMVAVFLKAPVQGYMDSARRAEMTDIADTALRRIERDLRTALPNSVRYTSTTCPGGTGTCDFLEYIPVTGGGRYRDSVDSSGNGNVLSFSSSVPAVTSFDVLGPMPTVATGDQVVVYNLGIPSADAYSGNSLWSDNRRAVTGVNVVASNNISINSTVNMPLDSCVRDSTPTSSTFGTVIGGCRFQVVQTPVTFVCNQTAGTLTRYWGYAIQSTQPTTTLTSLSPLNSALLASYTSTCHFTYDKTAQSYGLLTLRLTITEANANAGSNENVSLYSAMHVSNLP